MIPYPVALPCASRDQHGAAQFAGLVRSPMEAGNSRQRRSHRSLPHVITLQFVMPQASYAAWLTWVNAHAWDEWVQMNLPGLAASKAGTDTAPILVRFCTDLHSELLPVFRLWYWRVRVDCEWQPTPADLEVVEPPEPPEPPGANILLGLHLNGDLSDQSVRGMAFDTPKTSGAEVGAFVAGAGAYGQQAYRRSVYGQPVRSLDLPNGAANLGPEWQLSAWLRPALSAFGYAGGQFLSVNARGQANGNAIGGSGTTPPVPHSGQLSIRVQGSAGSAIVTVDYPGFNAALGTVDSVRLRTPAGGDPQMPIDGGLHHLGIACDVDGVRAYVDGVLVGDDGDASNLRPPGQRPMWNGTAYEDQYFLIGAAAAGSYSGVYGLQFPWGTESPAFAATFQGDHSELLVTNGPGSVTFKGSSITVPAAPFPNPGPPTGGGDGGGGGGETTPAYVRALVRCNGNITDFSYNAGVMQYKLDATPAAPVYSPGSPLFGQKMLEVGSVGGTDVNVERLMIPAGQLHIGAGEFKVELWWLLDTGAGGSQGLLSFAYLGAVRTLFFSWSLSDGGFWVSGAGTTLGWFTPGVAVPNGSLNFVRLERRGDHLNLWLNGTKCTARYPDQRPLPDYIPGIYCAGDLSGYDVHVGEVSAVRQHVGEIRITTGTPDSNYEPPSAAFPAPGPGPEPVGECPDYTTVTLREYVPPPPTAADLTELACPYVPPAPLL